MLYLVTFFVEKVSSKPTILSRYAVMSVTYTIRNRGPFDIIYTEEFKNRIQAIKETVL
jgi:hypothetical protein